MSELLPNLLVAGFPKCGTTTMHQILTDAGVRSTNVKEVGFLLRKDFDKGDLERAYSRSFGRKSSSSAYQVDATPWCIFDAEVPSKWRGSTSPKSIIMVRENMARMRSMFLDQWRGGHELRSFAAALADDLQSSSVIEAFSRTVPRQYVQTSLFWPYVDRWLASELGPSTRLVALESLKSSPEHVLDELGEWLGLEVRDSAGPANAGVAGQFSSAPAVLSVLNSKLGPWVPERLRPFTLSVYQPVAERLGRVRFGSPSVDPDLAVSANTIEQLRDLFAEDRHGLRTVAERVWLGPSPSWIEV